MNIERGNVHINAHPTLAKNVWRNGCMHRALAILSFNALLCGQAVAENITQDCAALPDALALIASEIKHFDQPFSTYKFTDREAVTSIFGDMQWENLSLEGDTVRSQSAERFGIVGTSIDVTNCDLASNKSNNFALCTYIFWKQDEDFIASDDHLTIVLDKILALACEDE